VYAVGTPNAQGLATVDALLVSASAPARRVVLVLQGSGLSHLPLLRAHRTVAARGLTDGAGLLSDGREDEFRDAWVLHATGECTRGGVFPDPFVS
jgi:hypothetical protein